MAKTLLPPTLVALLFLGSIAALTLHCADIPADAHDAESHRHLWICFALWTLLLTGAGLWGMTERQRRIAAEQTRREHVNLAERAGITEWGGDLSGALAHELSQPLAAILFNAQAARHFLQHEQPNLEEVGTALDEIIRDDKRAGEVIHRIKRLFRRGDITPGPVPLDTLLADVAGLMAREAHQHDVRIVVRAADGLVVLGDTMQLQQVLVNLLGNAIEAVATQAVHRRQVILEAKPLNATTATVVVRDFGPGIDDKHRRSLFQPFVTTKAKGLGLGLYICRTIVEAHGGSISAENHAEAGAVFKFTLTRYEEQA